ncbi:MAG: hypothetical protein YSLV5_ORF23 [Yellowstone Lake virophage 5]|uniref:Uncharacterized protein n=1 Tax=Yellowstone Lake virophage 5 TaxID=1557033 RepID=A0A0A0RJT6_9VIRU|nr:MAG: hypothetical protein ASQ69_gp23 [Yellowstone Lake virophage 5]AIW01881.1 MAG: hypothetical protein YSLV5_ORF23 [Yellowstone Lake virophage 5]
MTDAYVSRVCLPFNEFKEYFCGHMTNQQITDTFSIHSFTMENDDIRRVLSVEDRFINIDYYDEEYSSTIWWRTLRTEHDDRLDSHSEWYGTIDWSEGFAELEERWHRYDEEDYIYTIHDDE